MIADSGWEDIADLVPMGVYGGSQRFDGRLWWGERAAA